MYCTGIRSMRCVRMRVAYGCRHRVQCHLYDSLLCTIKQHSSSIFKWNYKNVYDESGQPANYIDKAKLQQKVILFLNRTFLFFVQSFLTRLVKLIYACPFISHCLLLCATQDVPIAHPHRIYTRFIHY